MEKDILATLARMPEDPKKIFTFILDSTVGIVKDLDIGKATIQDLKENIKDGKE